MWFWLRWNFCVVSFLKLSKTKWMKNILKYKHFFKAILKLFHFFFLLLQKQKIYNWEWEYTVCKWIASSYNLQQSIEYCAENLKFTVLIQMFIFNFWILKILKFLWLYLLMDHRKIRPEGNDNENGWEYSLN